MTTDQAVLTTALTALANGACPIRAMADGSKRPYGNWSEWQEHRPDQTRVHDWFIGGHPGLGIVCGEVSGRLECLEIEGRAMNLWVPLKERMEQAGLLDLLVRIAAGYAERSPSDGVHFLYRIDGESEMPGNTKLASRPVPGVVQIESMIETRGEGGFIVIAPSNGATHLTGKPWVMLSGGWDTVCTITREQRDALVRICESFDEVPTLVIPPPAPRRKVTPTAGGSGWVDTALAEWTNANPIEAVLQANGWSYLETDGLGELWRRPGKERGSCSARVNLNSRLHVFSTSTPFVAGQRHATTYDSLDVHLTYHLGRPPTANERVTHLRDNTTSAPRDDWSWVTVTEPAVAPPASHNADGAPSTAGVHHHQEANDSLSVADRTWLVTNLPDEFWDARPVFDHIRRAAWSRLLSPDALLGAVIPRYTTTVPVALLIPAVVVGLTTFDYMSMLVAPSGGGKTGSMATARDLLYVPTNPKLRWDLPLGSGEGLVKAFVTLREMKVDDTKVKAQVQIYDGIHFSVDEGSMLTEMIQRKGTTIAQTLCSAWSGAALGQTNAGEETNRYLRERAARVTAVMGIQTGRGEALVNGMIALSGLPQRIAWFSLVDPALAEVPDMEWPGRLDVPFLDPSHFGCEQEVTVCDEAWREVRSLRRQHGSGALAVDELDAHRYLLQLKTAGVFALWDDRRHISVEDWELARMVVDTSRRVRSTIEEAAALVRSKSSADRVRAKVGETLAIEDATRVRAIHNGARAMGKMIAQVDGPVKRRDLARAVAGRDRKVASIDEMLDEAIALRWVVDNSDGTFVAGDARPA